MIHENGNEKYTTGTCLASSHGKGWENLYAERRQHKAGLLPDLKPKSTEIAILLNGKLRVRRRGDNCIQDTIGIPGTVWLCPAGIAEHDVQLFGDMKDCMHLYIPADPISNTALQEFDVDPAHIRLSYDGGFQDPLIEHIARIVMSEIEQESPGCRLLIDSLKTTLAVHLLQNHSNIPNNKTKLAHTIGALDKRRLHRVEEYIFSHIDRNITLNDLAREACLSPFHFARAFKTAKGLAPHQFILGQKIKMARKLISNGDMSLLQISLMTGFSNQAHFTRAFKRITSLTPGQYRSKLIN